MLGIRASKNTNVKQQLLSDFATTSEANQWKIHKVGKLSATGANQIFTIEHGLGYTPACLSFVKQIANNYFQLNTLGGANYIDSNTLSIQLVSSGDVATYIIFKDFGA